MTLEECARNPVLVRMRAHGSWPTFQSVNFLEGLFFFLLIFCNSSDSLPLDASTSSDRCLTRRKRPIGRRPTAAADDRHLTIKALEMALKHRCPEIGLLHHSDQGSTHAGEDNQRLLAGRGVGLQHEPARQLL